MDSLLIAFVVLVLVCAGALFGMFVAKRLVPHHMTPETHSVITAAMAVVGTMTALVISLLISSANTAFVTRNQAIAQLSGDIVRLDHMLRHYGPETAAARGALRDYAAHKLDVLFGAQADGPGVADDPNGLDRLYGLVDALLALKPADERQRMLVQDALYRAKDLAETRWRIATQSVGSVPLPFLTVVVLWLTMLFASFGLFAPRNATALVTLFVCALAVSSAFKVMLDMDAPFGGPVQMTGFPTRLSPEPLARALAEMNR